MTMRRKAGMRVVACWIVALSFPFVPVRVLHAQVQVITAEEIAQAGVARLSDIFDLLDSWTAISTDGYAWDVSAAGLAPYQDASWLLLVDDVPMDLRVLGRQNINTLALSITQVDSITVISRPAIIAGRFAPAGVVHIHTRRPLTGAEVRGHVSGGNETGDPGPYRYTELATPNVDRIGPVFQGSASAAGSRWGLRVQGKADEHHATDERIRQRVFTLYEGVRAPQLLHKSARADAEIRGVRGFHRIFGAISRFQDLLFFDPLGLELPANHNQFRGGVTGRFGSGTKIAARYRAMGFRSQVADRQNRRGVSAYWQQDGMSGMTALDLRHGSWQTTFGTGMDIFRTQFIGQSGRHALRVFRFHGSIHRLLGRRARVTGEFAGSMASGAFGYGGLVTLTGSLGGGIMAEITGTLAQLEEEQGIWYWIREGYMAPGATGAAMPAEFGVSRTVTADLRLSRSFSDAARVTVSAGVRNIDGATLTTRTARWDAATTGFQTATTVHTGVSGRTVRFGLAADIQPHSSLGLRLVYTRLGVMSGDVVFREVWRRHPGYRAGATIRYAPDGRFTLYGRLRVDGSSSWAGYRVAAQDSEGRYMAYVPAAWLLDVTAKKRFWRDHLRMGVTLRNMLNQEHRTHPAGAITNMALYFHAEFFFGVRSSGR